MSEGSGRPKNVNQKMLDEALAPIYEALAALSEEAIKKNGHSDGIMSRAEYLGRMQTAIAAHRGEIAITPRFVNSMANQADTMYEGYLKICQGGGATNHELLTQAQDEIQKLKSQLSNASAREETLKRAFDEARAHREATSSVEG